MSKDIRQKIREAIQQRINAFATGNLADNAVALFQELGYKSDKRIVLDKGAFEGLFAERHAANMQKAFFDDWLSVAYLFQLTDEEISRQKSLFSVNKYNPNEYQSYSFVAIELENEHYARGKLSQITREVNKLFPMPAMILFKHGSLLTLSVINRRLHKRDESKDVLEKVTLIKDIRISPAGGGVHRTGVENVAGTHLAHIEILFDLSFDELKNNNDFTNFVELHNAWQKTLDTKELNKRFFQDLANWYFWAMNYVEFPDDLEKKKDVRNATNLIRLITRVVFIWFIKEKDLVPDMLFNKNHLNKILKDFNKNEKSDTYYPAILQNLFFGTLNQKMGERGFAKEGSHYDRMEDYGVKSLFRYPDKFAIKEKEVIELFKDIPFLNGGLFDCLDKPDEKNVIQYVDGFSRNNKKQARAPDFLFFSDEREVDLNEIFGTKNKKYKVKGLIHLLDSYKFTVAENTPIEEEIALDPELLGKVFENLLASYNPETQTTARKQTGSFYTPREIVNYMVDESLIAYLKQSLSNCHFVASCHSVSPCHSERSEESNDLMLHSIQHDKDEERLRDLLSYSENPNPFNANETAVLINSIDNGKILDPACGSGAFPMGILHKLVHILHKLDKDNEQWKSLQRKKAIEETEEAFKMGDKDEREQRLIEINDVFENNASDYGRKLYLIENCIYGIDIQPIAVQIAKLRFFISLIIDEKKQSGKDNFGIRSLPNLETKFIAANTLIELNKPVTGQLALKNPKIKTLEAELKQLRHDYFNARTRKEKLQCQKHDKELRQQIAKLLVNDGWDTSTAQQIVQFDPYDQNASAPFFDPEWMFGLSKGFDVVIGNPPYKILTTNNTEAIELKYLIEKYKSIKGSYSKNLFTLFIENGINILAKKATLSFIVPEGLFKTRSYSGCAEYLDNNGYVKSIATFTDYVFENAVTGNLIFVFLKDRKGTTENYHFDENLEISKIVYREDLVIRKIQAIANLKPLSEVATLFKGMVVKDRDLVLSENSRGKRNIFLLGKNISKWRIESKYYANFEELEIVGGTKRLEKHNHYPRILIRRTGNTLCCAFLNEKALTESTLYSCWSNSFRISNKYLISLLNSKILDYYIKKLMITNRQGFPQILMTDLELLPVIIPRENCNVFLDKLVDYTILLFDKQNDNFFERLINAIVYELYLPEEVTAAGANVLCHLQNLPDIQPLVEKGETEKALKTIEEVHKELGNPNHPVSVAMQKIQEIEEVKIIEGKNKG